MALFAAAVEKQLQRIKTAIAAGILDRLKDKPDVVLQQVAHETVKRQFEAASADVANAATSKASSPALAKAKGRAANAKAAKETAGVSGKAKTKAKAPPPAEAAPTKAT